MNIRVASFPGMGKPSRNPYLRLMKASLESLGVRVDDSNPDSPGLYWLVRNRKKIDILHFHWLQYHYINTRTMTLSIARYSRTVSALILARLLGYGIVWTVHNLHPHENPYPRADYHLRKLFFRFCSAVFTHSIHAKNIVEKKFDTGCPIHVIRHPHYINAYDNRISRSTARKILNIEMDVVVYCYIGEIRRYKGVDRLINAFRRLDSRNVLLLISGKPFSPDLEEEIRSLSGKDTRIRLNLEHVPDESLQTYMNASDFAVFPFRSVNVSGSLILAMSYARAVIFPETGGLTEYADGETAVVYDERDPDGLYRALVAALKTDPVETGKRAYLNIKQYSWIKTAREIAAVYADITNRCRDENRLGKPLL